MARSDNQNLQVAQHWQGRPGLSSVGRWRRLENDVGLQLKMEAATRKWFPASNSSREVRPQQTSHHVAGIVSDDIEGPCSDTALAP